MSQFLFRITGVVPGCAAASGEACFHDHHIYQLFRFLFA
jgi:hypothetical protein